MTKFTNLDGSKIDVESKYVARVRRALSHEDSLAKTRIDWGMMSLVKEEVEDVVRVISAELPTLIGVAVGQDDISYFNARKIPPVLPPISNMEPYGYRSSFKIMGYRQHSREDMDGLRKRVEDATS